MPPIATALIGFGVAARYLHAPIINAVPGLALTGIVSSRQDEIAALHPDVRCVSTAEIFADAAIELVVIATPNDSHATLARAALAAGKHVVIDKPFALDPHEGEALIAAAGAAGRVLSVYHNRRWDADFLTVRRLLDEGILGDIRLAELRWDRFRPEPKGGWREEAGAGSGVLADLGPHLIDQALLLFGSPDAVMADIQAQRQDARADDYFELTLQYPAMRAILSASCLIAAPRPRFALHGTHGSFVKYGIDPQEAILRAGGSPSDPGYGEDSAGGGLLAIGDTAPVTVPSKRGDWRCFYAGMASAIRDGAPPPVPAEDALAGLRIIAAARESAASGRVIPLRR